MQKLHFVILFVVVVLVITASCQKQQTIEFSLCETAKNYNSQYENQGVSASVHECKDNQANKIYLLEKSSEYEVGNTYYSSNGEFIYKYTEDDTAQVYVYDEQNRIIQEGEYSTISLPNYQCNENDICLIQ